MTTMKGYAEVHITDSDRGVLHSFSEYLDKVSKMFILFEIALKDREKITIGWIFKEEIDPVETLKEEFTLILKDYLQVPISVFKSVDTDSWRDTVYTYTSNKYREGVPKLLTLFNSDKVYLSDELYKVWLDIVEIEWSSIETVEEVLEMRLGGELK